MRRLPWVVAAVVGLAFGCSGDGQGPDAITNINVDGDWLLGLTLTNQESAVTCSAIDVPVTLHQDDSTFTGTITDAAAEWHCTGSNIVASESSFPPRQILDGTVHGTDVTFNFDFRTWTQSGSGDSSSLSGTAEWVSSPGNGEPPLISAGSWTAVRPPKP